MKRYSHILGIVLLLLLILATVVIYAADAEFNGSTLSVPSDDPYPGGTPSPPYPGEEDFFPVIINPEATD